jgi:hypothetical protein
VEGERGFFDKDEEDDSGKEGSNLIITGETSYESPSSPSHSNVIFFDKGFKKFSKELALASKVVSGSLADATATATLQVGARGRAYRL